MTRNPNRYIGDTQMQNLSLVKSEPFGTINCDFYRNPDNELFMTREQIGRALEYGDPIRAISKIHERNQERLNPNSVVVKLTTTDGKSYDTYLYTPKGIYEICRWSRQPKANAFFDWVYEVIESIRKHGLYAVDSILENPQLFEQVVHQLKEERRIRKLAEQQLLETTLELEAQKPLINFANTCLKSKTNILIRELAKLISDNGFTIGEKGLYKKLREWKLILSNDNEPSQMGMSLKLFEINQYYVFTGYEMELKQVTKVTPKGQSYILNKLRKELKNKLN